MNALAILHGERGPPPHFAGRDAELSAMRQRLDVTLSERGSAVEGLLLITGIPGIGKTHLADHFVRQAAEDDNVGVLTLGPVDLTSPEGLLLLMGRAMGAEDGFARAAGIDDKVSGVRGSVAGVVSGGVTLDAHRPALAFSHMLRATKDLAAWRGKALVMVIDEVQSMDSRSADQLLTLHMGQHECPVLTIAVGLQHSKSVLSRHGISRTSERRLGLLSQDETLEAVYRGLANLGVELTEDTAKALAEASMRFPQHVHGHIEAAYNVHRKRGEIDSPKAVAETLAMGREARDEYYRGRIGAMGAGAYTLYPLVEHMADAQLEDITRPRAESILGKDIVGAAVEHGVLSVDDHGLLSFGIPSFRAYMIRNAAAYRVRSDSPTP